MTGERTATPKALNETPEEETRPNQQQQPPQQTDVLKSKFLMGEFVILSQNYSHSISQRQLMADRIVKLMDQVFLATAMRNWYSHTTVANIRPSQSTGIIVDCTIVLTESIAYAAQQFGIALYDSLLRTNDRLASQASYIVDRNSIRFNTVPDKDLSAGIVPAGLLPASLSRELAKAGGAETTNGAPPGAASHQPPTNQDNQPLATPTEHGFQQQAAAGEAGNSVVWSEWSQWSSCVDKNGFCDAGRLHSRLRKCLAQHTGEQVDASQCKQRFNAQDNELEVENCARACSAGADPSSAAAAAAHLAMSDAPSVIGPQTAPSVLVSSDPPAPFPVLVLASPVVQGAPSSVADKQQLLQGAKAGAQKMEAAGASGLLDMFVAPQSVPAAAAAASAPGSGAVVDGAVVSSPQPPAPSPPQQQQQQQQQQQPGVHGGPPGAGPAATQAPLPELQQQMSCSNCTSDEICLLLISQKVPFCAKIKDRQDQSGCGGWCKAQSQLCQPAGANAFKCIHDSECLADEWRCHDSACIPISKRCDGHANCYDSSDERGCPATPA